MEPVWCLQKHRQTGFHFWSRSDRNPEQRTVKFKCDIEIREYSVPKDDNYEDAEEVEKQVKRTWSPEPYRLLRNNDKDSSSLLLLASLAVVLFTVTYKCWPMFL